MRYWEEYACGCVSKQFARKELPGYCPQHGKDSREVYRSDGKPANTHAITVSRELSAVRSKP
jgi:hypothetical protein